MHSKEGEHQELHYYLQLMSVSLAPCDDAKKKERRECKSCRIKVAANSSRYKVK